MVIPDLNSMLKEALEAKKLTNAAEFYTTYNVSFFANSKTIDFTFYFKFDRIVVKTVIYMYSFKASRDESEYEIPCNIREWKELIECSLGRAIEKLPEW